MKIVVSESVYKRAKEFASNRMKGSNTLYKFRGESNEEKMYEDILVGLVGEWGVYEYLKKKGIEVNKPDMNIYTSRNKSFNADFRSETDAYHVKSQTVASIKKYGHSWLLQRTDRIVKQPAENDHFVFTKVDGREVEILGLYKCKNIVYGECKVPRYRFSKIAVYLEEQKDEYKSL